VEDFNTPLLPMDMSSRQKLHREILELIDIENDVDLTDIYRTFHQNIQEYTIFSAPHGTFSKLNTYSETKRVSIDTRKLK
jgi:exonuclease III